VVPFVDLLTEHREIRDALDDAVRRVLDSSRFVLDEEVSAFEEEFATYCGVEHCVGVASGTDALALALRACGVGPGDEVVVPAFGFVATAFAVLAVGAAPVLVDVEDDSALLDVDRVAAALGERTRAVIAVHLYGRCMELADLGDLCAQHDLFLIEDAAQAHGARLRGRSAGAFGQAGCFSFYPSKNLGAAGDAGAVVTRDPELAARLRLFRNHGQRVKYRHTSFGTNSRLDEVQAAILRAKLPHLDRWNTARRRAAALYASLLDPAVRTPAALHSTRSSAGVALCFWCRRFARISWRMIRG